MCSRAVCHENINRPRGVEPFFPSPHPTPSPFDTLSHPLLRWYFPMEQSVTLKRTPLHAIHVSMGARMVDFGGWEMPVQYTGLVDEHHTVRKAVGLFDVSHMGEIEVRGPEA